MSKKTKTPATPETSDDARSQYEDTWSDIQQIEKLTGAVYTKNTRIVTIQFPAATLEERSQESTKNRVFLTRRLFGIADDDDKSAVLFKSAKTLGFKSTHDVAVGVKSNFDKFQETCSHVSIDEDPTQEKQSYLYIYTPLLNNSSDVVQLLQTDDSIDIENSTKLLSLTPDIVNSEKQNIEYTVEDGKKWVDLLYKNSIDFSLLKLLLASKGEDELIETYGRDYVRPLKDQTQQNYGVRLALEAYKDVYEKLKEIRKALPLKDPREIYFELNRVKSNDWGDRSEIDGFTAQRRSLATNSKGLAELRVELEYSVVTFNEREQNRGKVDI